MDHDLTRMIYSDQPFDPDPEKPITGIVKKKW